MPKKMRAMQKELVFNTIQTLENEQGSPIEMDDLYCTLPLGELVIQHEVINLVASSLIEVTYEIFPGAGLNAFSGNLDKRERYILRRLKSLFEVEHDFIEHSEAEKLLSMEPAELLPFLWSLDQQGFIELIMNKITS